jgi:hypothetical protein
MGCQKAREFRHLRTIAKKKRNMLWSGVDDYRVNRGQELVIGGYIPGTHGLDSIVCVRAKPWLTVGVEISGFVRPRRSG